MRCRVAFGLVLGLVALAALGASLVAVGGTIGESLTRRHAARIVDAIAPDLADIATSLGPGSPTIDGTGIVVGAGGIVVTNNHVIDGATAIDVTDAGDARTYEARVLGYDVSADVAVLQLEGASGLPSVGHAGFATAPSGATIVAVAADHDAAVGRITGAGAAIVERSELTGAARRLDGVLVTTAAVRPGFSGGPVVDCTARVVGMTVAYASGPTGAQGYAIPIAAVRRIAADVVHHRTEPGVHVGPTAGLGVRITPVSSIGAVVVQVPGGAPLGAAGLGAGDIIDTVAGSKITSPTRLDAVLEHLRPGDAVSVGWLTPSGASASATITLSTGPPA